MWLGLKQSRSSSAFLLPTAGGSRAIVANSPSEPQVLESLEYRDLPD